ncbi:alpha/beta fold hydrolase [Phenylobacterium sp.]|jgi:pimeloyl-ACP methyl ester carboxylesterase|uniref:alpha/beta fold hydrolase n=1 Tax=Phenylobacterium sp. TaxID=1871053 RepID=UPI000C92A788|nr:alpha/beta fold hydrolase [Phenylobacterium sp.]MAK81659.1 epoxide hydrolase [Phenylobacterium sp.]|tara:strand:- start:35641 stop:36504 length:864 start_codon:yes stop_codon:yes gene_type:complete
MTISTRTVEANGFAFAVDEAGDGDRLALCLHGFPESRFSWRAQMPLLAELGYRVWAPDLRGYGETEPKPQDVDSYRMERLLEDVAALIDAAGAREVMLVAHDWGAAVAWTFAARKVRPLTRLIIMNVPHPAVFAQVLRRSPKQMLRSWYMAFFQIPGLPERLLLANDARAIRRAFSGMAKDKSRFPETVLDRYAADAQRPGAMTGMINWYRAAARHPDFMREPWAKIEIPTLVIWGEADAALGLETLEGTDAFVPDLQIKRLPGVSHWVQQEAPEVVNALMADWLAT